MLIKQPVEIVKAIADTQTTAGLNFPTEKPQDYKGFSANTLYSLMVAEIAAARNQYDLTLNNYISEAKSTGDLGIISRAARLSQYFRATDSTLEMGMLWLAQRPDDIEANTLVAVAYMDKGQPLKALNHAETVLSLIEQKENTHRNAAITEAIANYSRDVDASTRKILISRYQRLSTIYPQHPSILVGLSVLYNVDQNTAKAYEVVKQALAIDSQYLPAVTQEIRLLQSDNQIGLALEKLEIHLISQPDNHRLRLLYARLLTQTDIDAAYREFTVLSEQSPKHLDIKFSRALIALELEKREVAEQLLNELLDLQYRPDTINFYLGNLAELDQNFEKALAYYLSVTGDDNYISAHSRAARIMATLGNTGKSQAHFGQLREQYPNQRPQLYTAEAEVLKTLGHVKAALSILNEAIGHYSDNITLRYSRSGLYEQTDQLALMESDLRHILALEPENASALNALGYFLTTRTQRHEDALALIQQALALKPNDPAIMDSMGWVLYNLGHIDEAIKYLRKAFELFPDPEVAAHLGEALWVKGKKQEARTIWTNNLKENPNNNRILDTMQRLQVSP